MNILASYKWIQESLKTTATPEEFARELSLRGPGVEKIITSGDSFKNIVVGRLITVDKHPNADKLRVCKVDVGGKVASQIVCGGSNLEVGQSVAVAMPGARVRWHGEGELITLESAELRGVKSEGMICASEEIGLGELMPSRGEKEILDLTSTGAKPGVAVNMALGFEDPIFDIEATTNRPDAFGIVGLAREAAASGLGKFTYSEAVLPKVKAARGGLKVVIDDKKLCARYMAAVVREVKVGESPAWMKVRLAQAGVRSINNIVDITNYVMLELGHPMHAFDRAAVSGDKIVVRKAKKGEKLLALDGKTYELTDTNLVIANGSEPMAIAGVMGGENSGSSAGTVSVVFEAAAFEPVSVRKTSRSHALITDASLRFEKGLSAWACEPALARALELVREICESAEVVEIVDVFPGKAKLPVFAYRPEFAEKLIGVKIPAQAQKKILEALGFTVSAKGMKWSVGVPYWREHDIEGERDLVEEVARIYGYHNIEPRLPAGELTTRVPAADLVWEDELKRFMEVSGWTELMTYAFTNAAQYAPMKRDIATLLAVSNPLSSEFTHLRDSLLPGMLVAIRENQERFPAEQVYEIANCYTVAKAGELPSEDLRFCALSYGHADEAFSAAKSLFSAIADTYGLHSKLSWRRVKEFGAGLMHPGRSMEVLLDGQFVGLVGELAPDVLRRAGIAKRVGIVSLLLDKVVPSLTTAKSFAGIPAFPSMLRDVSFVVDERVLHTDLVAAFRSVDAKVVGAERFDEYRGKEIGEGKKSLAYHLEFRDDAATMTSEAADGLLERIRIILKEKFSADVRS